MILGIKRYGEVLLVAVVILSLLAIFFNIKSSSGTKGIIGITGEFVKIEGQNYSSYTDFLTTKTIVSSNPPVIEFSSNGLSELHTDEEYCLLEYFLVAADGVENPCRASDYFGGIVKVEAIRNLSNQDCMDYYNTLTKTICFPEPGVYKVQLMITDKEKHVTTAIISFAVQ